MVPVHVWSGPTNPAGQVAALRHPQTPFVPPPPHVSLPVQEQVIEPPQPFENVPH